MNSGDMVNIPIELTSDEKGYFDRQCPNDDCKYIFKISMDDWKTNVSDEEVHCPMCGFIDTSDNWWTEEQIDKIKNIALSWATTYVQDELSNIFKKLERNTRNNKFIKIKYEPGKRVSFINNPIGQLHEWESEITCKECNTRYSVIGTAYFCPCCGHYSIEDIFDESLESITKMLDSIDEFKELLNLQYGQDEAENMSRSMIERSLGNVVASFQKFAASNFNSKAHKNLRPNDFQIIEKGSRIHKQEFSVGYEKWLSQEEIQFMNLMFQRRHIVEHNVGIIDERYLEKSDDKSYFLGQRVIININEVKKTIKIIRKLGDGLKAIAEREV